MPDPLGGGVNELALFAGNGLGMLAGEDSGITPVCAVELNAYCARRLMQRQNEGHLPPFPIWDDVRTFDGRPWKGIADVVSGGFPCQDLSSAGSGAGLDGERSGMYFQMERIIGEIRPRLVRLENSPNLVANGLERVLRGLARLGYDARWGIISAAVPAQATYARGAGYLPTPMASDNRDRGNTDSPVVQRRMRIGKQVNLSMLFKGAPCPSCVEGMMGIPMGWTGSAPLGTGKYHMPRA